MSHIALIVGLGNPGREYALTRHNLGFMVVEEFARQHGIGLREQSKFMGCIGRGQVENREVQLLLPHTYMNQSGQAVWKVIDYFKLAPGEVLVVCDDVELPFGVVRLRLKGGSGGHRGLQSCAAHLGTQEYPRLRVGVGRGQQELADYVLAPFAPDERQRLGDVMERATEVLQEVVKESVFGETR